MDLVDRWDEVEVDWQDRQVRNLTQGKRLDFTELSEADMQMLEAGGLIGYLHARD